MSDEHFLTRWSRRKREAAVEPAAPAKPDDPAAKTQLTAREELPAPQRDAATKAAATEPTPAAFDPASLPSLDSITQATDVRGFLAPGVPAALTREALRRAWSADPAIRDFRGLQENDWDFTKPDGVPGFGEIGSDVDVKGLVARIFGDVPEQAPADIATHAGPADQPVRRTSESAPIEDRQEGEAAALSRQAGSADLQSGPEESVRLPVAGGQPEELMHRNKEIAMQHDDLSGEGGQTNRRSRGGALPKM